MTKRVLVTGGCGYIGSHTLVALAQAGFEIVSIDNHVRSHAWILDRVTDITGIKITNYEIDLCDYNSAKTVFETEKQFDGIIHFAAYKAVGESMANPMLYYQNNVFSMINILRLCQEFGVPNFVFSSSCTVYGQAEMLPVSETSPLLNPTSPYGRTKSMGETMLLDLIAVSDVNVASLRYFNPVGAHPSALIGELPLGVPDNLIPYITQTAIGKRKNLTIFGQDYPTKDGTCVRDYVHVCDIADAHLLALEWLLKQNETRKFEAFNLGFGNGISVLEAVNSFITTTKQPLNYQFGQRRLGDVAAIYADNRKAKQILQWQPRFNLAQMMESAWLWELALTKN